MKKYILASVIFFCFISITSAFEDLILFANNYKSNQISSKFVNNNGIIIDDLSTVIDMIERVTYEIDKGTIDPRIHWLRPMLNDTLIQMYRMYHKKDFIEKYGSKNNYGPDTIKYLEQRVVDYNNALLLNKTATKDERLNEEMLTKIYISSSLPAQTLEMASRERLKFIQQDVIENESHFYHEFYTEMINDYIRDKDYDNALRILKEFDGRQSGMLEKNLPVLDEQKKKWEEAEILIAEEKKQSVKPIAQAVNQQPAVIKSKDITAEDKTEHEVDNNKNIYISIILAFLLLIGFVFFKIIRKK